MKKHMKSVISRRKMLKNTAAFGAASASVMLGCPAVHANEAPTFAIWEPPLTWVVSLKNACMMIPASK